MNYNLLAVLAALVALSVTMLVYPFVEHFARRHSILDNPSSRKLHRDPVPVIGGVAVFIGILSAFFFLELFVDLNLGWIRVLSFTVMLAVGIWDDITDIPATLKFLIEICVVWILISITETCIDSLHGLWGVYGFSPYLSVPLSIITGVGVINAINMIDGVDGYCSGFCVIACTLFSVFFFHIGYCQMGIFALVCACSLVPFFLHNVFGRASKMFIGDSGTLMLGIILTMFVFEALSDINSSDSLEMERFGVVPFTLATLAIPVFDTLRVTGWRILKGASPFKADRHHLHHLFITAGFSHIGTAFCIIMMNMFVVASWFVSWRVGATVDVQLYIVVGLSLGMTFVMYPFMEMQRRGGGKNEDGTPQGTCVWKFICKLGAMSHVEKGSVYRFLRRMLDFNDL